MRRRDFCRGGLTALAAAALPHRPLYAQADGATALLGLDGKPRSLPQSALAELRAALRGELLTPGDAGYDGARRLWNAAFNRKPALIARCAGAADVARAVSFAATHQLLTAVRGGGHSLSGQSAWDDAFMIDLAPMRAVDVDPQARRARVGAGALLGYLDREAQAFRLATPAGTVADTGVAGLTLGGGVGRLARRFGLSCDNLEAVELVTADGQWRRASAQEHPELFWALRGGGGNFGVVTAFVFRLHPVEPLMFGGALVLPFDNARQTLRNYAEILADAPDELYVDVDLETDRELGRIMSFDVCYSGPQAQAERVLAPLRKLGKPLKDGLRPALYTQLQGSADTPGFSRFGAYVKGGLISGITGPLADAMVEFIEQAPSDALIVWAQHQGGAIGRIAPSATAYFGRGASHNVGLAAFFPMEGDAGAANRAWVKSAWARVEPLTHGNYVNIANTEEEDRVHAAYGANYPRLARLKRQYDPNNLFRLNANIKPV